jgi:hypothetical protein
VCVMFGFATQNLVCEAPKRLKMEQVLDAEQLSLLSSHAFDCFEVALLFGVVAVQSDAG